MRCWRTGRALRVGDAAVAQRSAPGWVVNAVTAQIGSGTSAVQQTIGEIFSLFPNHSLVSGSVTHGVVCEHFERDISLEHIYGITLTLTEWPETIRWRTPDQNWSLRDLAVVTFKRDGNTIERHGIHTKTWSLSPIPAWPIPWLWVIPTALQPVGLTIEIDFLPGVCGEMTAQLIPY